MANSPNIYTALAKAQSEMGAVVKGATNQHFKTKYADLSDVMSVALPPLNANGIAVWHSIVTTDLGREMRTTLTHGETGTSIECDVPLLVSKNDMQGMKSATTYAKRIGIESLTGIAPDDDDGNAAAKKPQEVDPDAVENAVAYMHTADTLDELRQNWMNLPTAMKRHADVVRAKEDRKDFIEKATTQARAMDEVDSDEIPH